MEENNNNNGEKNIVEKGVEKGVNMAKDKAKKSLFQLIKPYLPIILYAIGILLLILLAIGLILLIYFLIQSFFGWITNIFGGSSKADATSEEATTSHSVVIQIDDNGAYKLEDEDLADKILAGLEEQKVDSEASGFITEDLDDMIDKYIKAEVQTSYPETNQSGSDFDGIITIYRASDSGNKKLNYMKYSKFKDYEGADVYDYFSIDPETFKLCIAREGNSTTFEDKDGNSISGIEGESSQGVIKELIDYKLSLQGASVPISFFIALHNISQDTDFMNDFVDMVLGEGKDEPIVLTYVESKSITTTRNVCSGTKDVREETVKRDPDNNIVDTDIKYLGTQEMTDDEIATYYTPEYYQRVDTTTSGSLHVTEADTWIRTVEKTITSNNRIDDDFSEVSSDDVYKGTVTLDETTTTKPSGASTTITENADITITETTETKSEYYGYTIVNNKDEIKADGFAEFIHNDYPKVENNLTTAPSTLFYLLQQDENTQQHEKIMRYVIYKLSGIDYGVTELDASMFSSYDLSSVNGFYGNSLAEKIWFAIRNAGFSEYAAAGALGNLHYEANNSLDASAVERGQSEGDAGIGLAQWSGVRKERFLTFVGDRDWTDEDLQIEFLIAELVGSGANGQAIWPWCYRCYMYGEYDEYANYDKYWSNLSNIETAGKKEYESNPAKFENEDEACVYVATRAFCYGYEGPGSHNLERLWSDRYQPALMYYNQFHGKTAPIGGITTDEQAEALELMIENEWLHTKIHYNYEYQNGPFLQYWERLSLEPFQCTWWANGRAGMYLAQNGTKYKQYPTQLGHGGQYYEVNMENGYFEYGQTPRPNSIISWTGGKHGHVAYVEGVTSDGIYISHAGSGMAWKGVEKIPLSGQYANMILNGYIYLDSPLP